VAPPPPPEPSSEPASEPASEPVSESEAPSTKSQLSSITTKFLLPIEVPSAQELALVL
jgi:hypothetical protein